MNDSNTKTNQNSLNKNEYLELQNIHSNEKVTLSKDSITLSKQQLKNSSPELNSDLPCPLSSCNWFQTWFYGWLTPLLAKGKIQVLLLGDLWALDEKQRSKMLYENLKTEWEKERIKPNPSLGNALYNSLFWKIAPLGILRFISDLGTDFSPLLVSYLINFVTDSYKNFQNNVPLPSIYYGLAYAFGLFLVQIYITTVQNRFFFFSLTAALDVRTAVSDLIFRKATNLSAASRKNFNSGKVINLVSTDAARIELFMQNVHVLWTSPLQVLIISGLLIIFIGPSALCGIVLLALLGPLQRYLMSLLQGVRRKVAPVTDKRIKKISEIMRGIRIIKFFTWEDPIQNQVEEIRNKEVYLIRKRSFIQAFVTMVAFSIPILSSSIAIIIYSITSGNPADQILCSAV